MFQTATTTSGNLIILVQSWKRDHEHLTYNRRWNVTNGDNKTCKQTTHFFNSSIKDGDV